MTAGADPLVLARLQKIAETTDGPSLVQAYMDLLTFGPSAFVTVLAVVHGEVALPSAAKDPADARRAILGVLAWLGHRYPDELFIALGDPHHVTAPVACSIEPIDDPRTTAILLAVAQRDEAATVLVPALVRRRDDRVVPLLKRALFNTNATIRARGAEGLYVMRPATTADALRATLAAEPDDEVRAILADALVRIEDPDDERELRWFWVILAEGRHEMGIAAFDEDDALTVLDLVEYAGRGAPPARSITDLDASGPSAPNRRHPVGLPAWRGLWAPHAATVWRQPDPR